MTNKKGSDVIVNGELLGTIKLLPGGMWHVTNPYGAWNAFSDVMDAAEWISSPVSLHKDYAPTFA